MKFRNPPPFPTGEPAFVQELRREEEIPVCWETAAQPEAGEADFRRGLRLLPEFPDPEQLLLTAEREMHRFLQRNNLAKPDGAPLITRRAADLAGETFRMTVTADAVTLEAGNTEGIRRGLYTILDSLAGSRGPFLPLGCSTRRPWLKNRISRCFFSPIKRPPFQRDELLDEVDYYPEAYLARLAREGVNGLWLSISFREVCTTSFYAVDPQAQQRLGKLRRTVETCRKYGIRIWVFGIEPAGWEEEKNPCPPDAPELQGPKFGSCTSFCPASETAQRYLYECTRSLFSAVPELGGLITISLGERVTSCLSTLSVTTEKTHPCGAACSRSPSEILACVLRPMTEGMHAAAPNAELISWLYLPAEDQAAEWIYQLPEALPHNVILAFNFESGCTARQLGKLRVGGDYWLSRTGPSDRFGRMVQAVRSHCSPGAKIQACCSHEVASVPFVPVPGQLYRKYRAMRQLGVEHVIQCWFFGNYPGLMNRAAGKLAFEEFTGSEESFLEELAAPEWGRRNAPVMATVWRLFTEAYANYPLDIQFQYYGPMHDGPVWPLHLKQVRRSLPRSWKPDAEPAGDFIGEAITQHTLREAAVLARLLADGWRQGLDQLKKIRWESEVPPARRRDISLMKALELLFCSGANILEFYLLRARLLEDPPDAPELLRKLEAIVHAEIAVSSKLAELCNADPRLGYHSEAEICKYYPEKLHWRAEWLKRALATDFSACRRKMAAGIPPSRILTKPLSRRRTGRWYRNGHCRWRADADDAILRITVESFLRQDETAEEELKFFLADRNGIRPPWTALRLNRAGSDYDGFACARFRNEEFETSWRAVVEIPQLMLDADAVCFGFLHIWCTRDGEHCAENYPAGEFPLEPRLHLDFFTPERLILLEWNVVGSENRTT